MIPRKLSIEVLLDPRSLPLPTIGLHHMEGRFLHLLTLLKIKFLWITLGSPEGYSPKQKAPTVFIRSRDEENASGSKHMPIIDPSDLIGRRFLLPPEENMERHRAKVTDRLLKLLTRTMAKGQKTLTLS